MNTWDRQPDETAKAFAAFVVYRDLGASRSIDRAYVALTSKRHRKTSKTTASHAPRHWFQWSIDNEWVARCEDWDAEQQRIADELHQQVLKERIKKMMEDEYSDYEAELERFRRIREHTPTYEREAMKESVEKKTDEDGKPIKVVTRVHTAKLNIGAHRGITRWRMMISQLGRLNAGLPTQVTASKVDANVKQVLTWKDAVEQARDGNEPNDEEIADAE